MKTRTVIDRALIEKLADKALATLDAGHELDLDSFNEQWRLQPAVLGQVIQEVRAQRPGRVLLCEDTGSTMRLRPEEDENPGDLFEGVVLEDEDETEVPKPVLPPGPCEPLRLAMVATSATTKSGALAEKVQALLVQRGAAGAHILALKKFNPDFAAVRGVLASLPEVRVKGVLYYLAPHAPPDAVPLKESKEANPAKPRAKRQPKPPPTPPSPYAGPGAAGRLAERVQGLAEELASLHRTAVAWSYAPEDGPDKAILAARHLQEGCDHLRDAAAVLFRLPSDWAPGPRPLAVGAKARVKPEHLAEYDLLTETELRSELTVERVGNESVRCRLEDIVLVFPAGHLEVVS